MDLFFPVGFVFFVLRGGGKPQAGNSVFNMCIALHIQKNLSN